MIWKKNKEGYGEKDSVEHCGIFAKLKGFGDWRMKTCPRPVDQSQDMDTSASVYVA